MPPEPMDYREEPKAQERDPSEDHQVGRRVDGLRLRRKSDDFVYIQVIGETPIGHGGARRHECQDRPQLPNRPLHTSFISVHVTDNRSRATWRVGNVKYMRAFILATPA